jgi:hypothetical protein
MTVKCSRANSTEIFVRWMFLIQSYLGIGLRGSRLAWRIIGNSMLGARRLKSPRRRVRGIPESTGSGRQSSLPVRLRGKIKREHPVPGHALIQQTLRMEIPAQIILRYATCSVILGANLGSTLCGGGMRMCAKKLILRVQGHARFFTRLGRSRVRKASFVSQGLAGGKQPRRFSLWRVPDRSGETDSAGTAFQ